VGGEIFHARPDRPWDPPTLLHKWYRLVKRERRGVDHPSPSSPKVKERVELYLSSSSLPSWSCSRVYFTFCLLHLTCCMQQLSVICCRYICAFIHRVSQSKKPSGAVALLGLPDPEDSTAILTTYHTTQRNNPEELSLLQLVTEACCMG
jgi:hypothetical protein